MGIFLPREIETTSIMNRPSLGRMAARNKQEPNAIAEIIKFLFKNTSGKLSSWSRQKIRLGLLLLQMTILHQVKIKVSCTYKITSPYACLVPASPCPHCPPTRYHCYSQNLDGGQTTHYQQTGIYQLAKRKVVKVVNCRLKKED